jgi:hypothetical protein
VVPPFFAAKIGSLVLDNGSEPTVCHCKPVSPAGWPAIAQELFFKDPGDRLSANDAVNSAASGRLSELQPIPSTLLLRRDGRLIPQLVRLVKKTSPGFLKRSHDALQ